MKGLIDFMNERIFEIVRLLPTPAGMEALCTFLDVDEDSFESWTRIECLAQVKRKKGGEIFFAPVIIGADGYLQIPYWQTGYRYLDSIGEA